MKVIFPLLVILTLFSGLFFSCATSSGSLFSSMTARENTEDGTGPDKSSQTPETGISVTSDPEQADIFLNQEYMGITPLTLTDLKAGSYSLELRKEGYRAASAVIDVQKNLVLDFDFTLERITGFISVTATPSDALVTLGDTDIVSPGEAVPVGRFLLSVRSFGYDPYEETVDIEENINTTRTVVLSPAPFDMSDLRANRSRFNPADPGALGKMRLSFTVTAPGSGQVYIYDSEDNAVNGFELPAFTDWEQDITWDGKDGQGNSLPDGTYTVALSASGDDGRDASKEAEVIIDRSQAVTFRSLFHGSSGLLYAQTTEMLPKDVLQVSFLVLGHVEPVEGVVGVRFPASLGLRFSAMNLFDCVVSLTAVPQTNRSVAYSAGGSARYRFLRTPGEVSGNMAVSLRGTFQQGETYDSYTNYGALYAGFPMQMTAGPFGMSLTPEFAFSTKRVVYPADGEYPEQDIYVWGYGRAGLFLDFGNIGTGLSYALRLKPFSEGFAVHYPMAAGWEFWFFIPNSQVVAEAAIAGEFGDTGFYLMGGFGFTFFN